MQSWQIIVSSLGGSVALNVALAFLFREWISTRIRESIKHEYDVEMEKLKGRIQGEIEGAKAEHQKAIDVNQIRFSKLHAEQAEAAKGLFSKLAKAQSALLQLTTPLKQVGADGIQEYDRRLVEAFRITHNEAVEFFAENRIFFPLSMCDKVETYQFGLRDIVLDYNTYEYGDETVTGDLARERDKLKRGAYKQARGEVHDLLRDLEGQFRGLLGMIPDVETYTASPSSAPHGETHNQNKDKQ